MDAHRQARRKVQLQRQRLRRCAGESGALVVHPRPHSAARRSHSAARRSHSVARCSLSFHHSRMDVSEPDASFDRHALLPPRSARRTERARTQLLYDLSVSRAPKSFQAPVLTRLCRSGTEMTTKLAPTRAQVRRRRTRARRAGRSRAGSRATLKSRWVRQSPRKTRLHVAHGCAVLICIVVALLICITSEFLPARWRPRALTICQSFL